MNLEFMMSNYNPSALFIVIIFFKNIIFEAMFTRISISQKFSFICKQASFDSHLGQCGSGFKTRGLSLLCFCFCQ